MSENAVFFNISSQKVILQFRPQLNKYVQNVQAPATPKPYWKTVDS